jgi:GNAT superfamily N-acetyltransferase
MITHVDEDRFEVIVKGCRCYLYLRESRVELWSLRTEEEQRGQGLASQVIEEAQEFARTHALPLYLKVGGSREGDPTPEELFAFYSKRGFKGKFRGWGTPMLYHPPAHPEVCDAPR